MRILITAGPTHEPIDAVRYIANRSSGRLGIALAEAAAGRGLDVTLLLGPTPRTTTDSRIRVVRFQSTADLQALLAMHFPECDTLIMSAAVADYRPKRIGPADASPSHPAPTKLRRSESPLTLELEPTPDLLAEVAARKRPGQIIVGFALEPEDRLLASAQSKLERKQLDAIVANPLETMDAPTVRATVMFKSGDRRETGGAISKEAFGPWLLDALRLTERRA
ncbi:MAG: phosphopantothenoylcysteine decarboxylase [Phycisphaerales bacterium]